MNEKNMSDDDIHELAFKISKEFNELYILDVLSVLDFLAASCIGDFFSVNKMTTEQKNEYLKNYMIAHEENCRMFFNGIPKGEKNGNT